MAAASDKARFFLEQSVPELKEDERKQIFTADEITSISKRRSDFEHKINARGSSASDYARYAEFEVNVDALRRKRVRRLGVKATAHNGQRRIFFVFDRGTRKFPGDVGLWMQTIEYAKKQKAHKKLLQIFTNVLRLHPAKPDLWIYAAQYSIQEHGDMTEARSYMQRGLRFCKGSRSMWVEYVRLEMSYMAKIQARRRILGVDSARPDSDVPKIPEADGPDMLRLPALTAEDINPGIDDTIEVDANVLRSLAETPALSGAIPIAIFDAAMITYNQDPDVAFEIFEVASDFGQIPCAVNILQHIEKRLVDQAKTSWHKYACQVILPLSGMPASSPTYPQAFRRSLKVMNEGLQSSLPNDYVLWARRWLARLREDEDLDHALVMIIQSKLAALTPGVAAEETSK